MSSSHDTINKPCPRIVCWIAYAFSCFQVWTAAYSRMSSQVFRATHVGFVLLMVFTLYPGQFGRLSKLLGWIMGVVGFGLAFYHWIFESDLTARAGQLTDTDMVVGIITIILVFEAARRVMGWALPTICGIFLAYAMFGEYLSGPLIHRPFDFDQIVGTLSFGVEGIYGIPTYVSSTYIYLFILFGAFLEQAGMITLFSDFAMGTVGHTKG